MPSSSVGFSLRPRIASARSPNAWRTRPRVLFAFAFRTAGLRPAHLTLLFAPAGPKTTQIQEHRPEAGGTKPNSLLRFLVSHTHRTLQVVAQAEAYATETASQWHRHPACAPLLRRNPSDLGFRTISHPMNERGQAEACPTKSTQLRHRFLISQRPRR